MCLNATNSISGATGCLPALLNAVVEVPFAKAAARTVSAGLHQNLATGPLRPTFRRCFATGASASWQTIQACQKSSLCCMACLLSRMILAQSVWCSCCTSHAENCMHATCCVWPTPATYWHSVEEPVVLSSAPCHAVLQKLCGITKTDIHGAAQNYLQNTL